MNKEATTSTIPSAIFTAAPRSAEDRAPADLAQLLTAAVEIHDTGRIDARF